MTNIAAQVLIPSAFAFALGIVFAPALASILYRKKAWKKKAGKGKGIGGGGTPVFDELHKEREVSTPRMGGILIWASVLATAIGLFFLAKLFGGVFESLNFINRNQTWLPLCALAVGAAVGFLDDLLEIVRGRGGLSLSHRLLVVAAMGLIGGSWFYAKLDVASIGIPFADPLYLGPFIIPLFAIIPLFLYASGTIDGIDGLAGGVFAIVFMAYAGIAFGVGAFSLAAFAAACAGAILAFLWFNIPPARFYMSETGSMALTLSLAMTAFASDALAGGVGVSVLPLVAFPLTATVATTLLQVSWKRAFNRKLFRVAPIHHHFEALGWPPYKVTMRYWVITIIMSVLGLSIALLSA